MFKEYVRRSTQNLLISCCLAMIAVFVVIGFSYRYIFNVLQGPQDLTHQLSSSSNTFNLQQMDYVTIAGTPLNANNQPPVKNGDAARYEIINFDNKYLIVKGYNSNISNNIYTGTIVSLDSVARNFLAKQPDLQQASLPFMLDASAEYYTLTKIGLVVGSLILLWCVFALRRVVIERRDPTSHTAILRLRCFGKPEQIAREIDLEAQSMRQTIGKSIHLTQNWLISEPSTDGADLHATRLDDIVYVCKRRHMQRYAPPFSLLVFGQHKPMMVVHASEKSVDELMDALYQRVPWIIIERENTREKGVLSAMSYGEAYVKYWKENRAALIAEVEQRRKLYAM